MKNKKGFTLIELLVIVVLMTGILGIVLVSVNEISEKQKIKAKEGVEEQIIVAAKSYFKDNQYFIRSIVLSEEEEGYVSLGTLVELDYIKLVTDPTTNKKMDACSFVKVTPSGYEFVDDDNQIASLKEEFGENCIMDEPKIGIVSKKEITTPSSKKPSSILFSVNLYSKKNSSSCEKGEYKDTYTFDDTTSIIYNDWLNKASNVNNGVFLEIEAKTLPSSDTQIYFSNVVEEISETSEEIIGTDTITYCLKNDGIYNIKMKNTYNSNEYLLNIKLDREAPEFVVTGVPNDWTSAEEVKLEITMTDKISKVKSEKRFWNETGLTEADANSTKYAWDETKIKYYGGGSDSLSNLDESKYTDKPTYKSQGYRKGIVKSCDYAKNCAFSSEYVVKIDRTPPSVAKVVTTEKDWTNKSVDYNIEMKDELSGIKYYLKETNKTNLTYSQSRSNSYKWDKKTEKYPDGYTSKFTNDDKGFGNEYETTGTFSKKNQGRRLIRIKVCDYAGLCTVSDADVAMIDTEPPEVIEADSGYVHCLKAGSTTSYNAHGYSIKFKDNLSGANAKVYEYFSSWDCGSTDEFHWADSTNKGYTTSQNSQGTYTTFVGCTNNPTPALRFSLIDAAGNKYKNSKGNYYYGLSHSKGSISSSNKKECDSTVWYNKSPNR